MTERWESQRSRFNHGWLKNQLIVALRKAIQVQSGLVVNDRAQVDLLHTLKQWSTQRTDAERVLDEVRSSLSESGPTVDETADERLKRIVNEVERQRWVQQEQPEAKWRTAQLALFHLDRALCSALPMDAVDVPALGLKDLSHVLEAASRVGAAFSGLTLCRSLDSIDGGHVQ